MDRLSILSFMWAFQALVQKMRQDGLRLLFFEPDILTGIQFVLIFAVLFHPRSLALFAALLFSLVLEKTWHMPLTYIHPTLEYIFSGLFSAGISLASLGFLFKSNNSLAGIDRREALFECIAPSARVSLIFFYLFVVLHKLNTDFLDYTLSCAPALYQTMNDRLFINLPTAPWALKSIVALTLIIELAIPILFCFKKTWKWGVCLGLVFHLFLSFPYQAGIKGFTSLLYALYIFFLPGDFADSLKGSLEKISQSLSLRISLFHKLGLAFLLVIGGMLVMTVRSDPDAYLFIYEFLFWIPGNVLILVLYGFVLSQSAGAVMMPLRFPGLQKLLWVFPLLVVVIGISPYIGLRTEAAWAMFSNLRTEGPYNNHLFIPNSLRVTDYQDDLIEITKYKTSRKDLTAKYANQYVPFFQFTKMIHNTKEDFEIHYIRDGQALSVTQRHGQMSDPALRYKQWSWLQRKYLIFRMIDKDSRQTCTH